MDSSKYLFCSSYIMPNKPAAVKALRQSFKRAERNKKIKKAIKESLKKTKKIIHAGQFDEAEKFVRETSKVLAMAAQKGVMKKNTASRKTSRLARYFSHAKGQTAFQKK